MWPEIDIGSEVPLTLFWCYPLPTSHPDARERLSKKDCLNKAFKGQVQGMGWFLTQFQLKLAENNDIGETVIGGYKCTKKGIFCHTESIAMTPKSHDHMPTTSLWGVTAKWPTWAPKAKLILCPRDPQGYSQISLSLSCRILKEYWKIVSASKQTPCGIPWGLRNRTHWSAYYTNGRDAAQQESSFELYKFNLLSPHCGSIVWEFVHCYTWGRLQIVTVRGNTVGWHS